MESENTTGSNNGSYPDKVSRGLDFGLSFIVL